MVICVKGAQSTLVDSEASNNLADAPDLAAAHARPHARVATARSSCRRTSTRREHFRKLFSAYPGVETLVSHVIHREEAFDADLLQPDVVWCADWQHRSMGCRSWRTLGQCRHIWQSQELV
jgi:hypothetical protein